MTLNIQGIAASSGIAIAKAFRLENPEFNIEKKSITNEAAEIARLEAALEKAKTELEAIKDHAFAELGADKAAIFEAHLLVLNDPELVNPVKDKVNSEKVNAEFAMDEVASMFISMFENMDNEYMKERAADIRDVTKRVLAHLLGINFSNLVQFLKK